MNKEIAIRKIAVLGLVLSACLGQAATYTWDAGGGVVTVWSEPTNWTGDSVPAFLAGDVFDLSKINLVASGTSTVDANQTLGLINIGDSAGNSNTWLLNNSGGAVITLDNGGSAAQINQVSTSANNTISLPLALKSNLNVTNNSGATLTVSGSVSSSATSGTQTITTQGSAGGVINLNGHLSDGGTGGRVAVVMNNPNGELRLTNAANAFTGGTTLTAGTARIETGALGPNGSSLTVNGNVQLRSNLGGPTTQNLGTFNILSNFRMDANYGMMTISGSTAVNLGGATRTIDMGTAGAANLDTAAVAFAGTGQTINNGTLRVSGSGGSVTSTTPVTLRFGANPITFNNANFEIGANATTRFATANTFGTNPNGVPNVTVNTGGALNLSGRTADGLSYDLTIGSLSGSGNVVNSAGVSGTATLVLNGTTSSTFSGTIKDGGYNGTTLGRIALSKQGSSTQTLAGVNTYTGATTVSGGTLLLSGGASINNTSGITVSGSGRFRTDSTTALSANVTLSGGTFAHNSSANYAGTLTFSSGVLAGTNWNGNLGGLTIGTGQTLSPGNSPGTTATTSQTWAGGGSYIWEINDATGTAGSDPGWDLISGTGGLAITATEGSKFNIYITSLSLGNTPGDAANFNAGVAQYWLIADFGSAITLDAAVFNIDSTGFSNANTGSFSILRGDSGSIGGDASQLYIAYAVPEPQAGLLLALGIATVAVICRRRTLS